MTAQPIITPGPDTDPGPVPPEAEADWYFTFGTGHRLYSGGRERPPRTSERVGKGMSLFDRYVIVKGTYGAARERMFETFGEIWSWQYDAAEGAAMAAQYELTELVLTPGSGVAW